jgi:hypothetical protein
LAQFTADVFPRLGQKRQDRLIAVLAFVLWVVTLAPSHLVAEQRMHRRIGVQRYHCQLNVSRLPHSFPHPTLHVQQLPRNAEMQRRQKATKRTLRW